MYFCSVSPQNVFPLQKSKLGRPCDGHRRLNKHEVKNETSVKVDSKCRFVFPCLFLVFNVSYWCYYLNWHGAKRIYRNFFENKNLSCGFQWVLSPIDSYLGVECRIRHCLIGSTCDKPVGTSRPSRKVACTCNGELAIQLTKFSWWKF